MKKLFLIIATLILSSFIFASVSNVTTRQIDTQLSLLTFNSSYISGAENINIITPANYATTSINFPTLYLLHGWSGSYQNWVQLYGRQIEALATQYQMIIVMPDGGYASWYLNSPINPKSQYQSLIALDCVPLIDKTYKTLPYANKRAITGLSMGGFGALALAGNYPNLFGAAGAMSGGVELSYAGSMDPSGNNFGINQVLGNDTSTWKKYDIINYLPVYAKNNTALILNDGTSDIFIKINRELNQAMLDANIPHDYTESPGAHTWSFWTNAINYQTLFFSRYFQFGNTQGIY